MNLKEVFQLRELLINDKNLSLAQKQVFIAVLQGEYDKHENSYEVALDDIKFLEGNEKYHKYFSTQRHSKDE